MQSLQEILTAKAVVWVSHFAWRPSKLFEGANMLLAIWVVQKADTEALYTTRYHRWSAEYRAYLFPNMSYLEAGKLRIAFRIPKLYGPFAVSLLAKCDQESNQATLLGGITPGKFKLYYFRAVLYWFKILVSPPILKENGKNATTGEMKALSFDSEVYRDVALAVLASNLYAFYYTTWSSCQVVNSPDLKFPVNLAHLIQMFGNKLRNLARELIEDVEAKSIIQTRNYSARGRQFKMQKQYFFFKKSKSIIDEIN